MISLFFVIRFSSNDIYVKVSPDETKFDMSKEINLTVSYTVLVGKIGLHKQTSVFQLQKYQNTLFQVFFVSKQTVRNVVALTDFHLIFSTRWKNVAIHKYLCICLCLVSIKGKLVLVLKTNASLRYYAS